MKKNPYAEMTKRHQKEFDELPIQYAFSDRAFEEGMRALGLEPTDTDKVYGLGGTGGFYRKSDSELIHSTFDRNEKELTEALQDPDFAYHAFCYELANHEYTYTGVVDDAVEALGLTEEDLLENPILVEALEKAMRSFNQA